MYYSCKCLSWQIQFNVVWSSHMHWYWAAYSIRCILCQQLLIR